MLQLCRSSSRMLYLSQLTFELSARCQRRYNDSDFIDLSSKPRNPHSQRPSIICIPPIAQQTSSPLSRRPSPQISYHVHGIGSRFPENSHGFLYYHHDPRLPLTSGAVRFRLTPDAHVSSFSAGMDLMSSDGRTV
ncbi:hypothetical protein Hypma_000032, partial [Hypsizygus marmoreus]